MKGEKEAVLSQLDSLKDKLNVSEVGRSVIQHSLVAYLYNGCVCVCASGVCGEGEGGEGETGIESD